MIVAMKKVSIIVQPKDIEETVSALRALGVIHIEHQIPPKGDEITALEEDIALNENAINSILAVSGAETAKRKTYKKLEDWKASAKHIINLKNRRDQLDEFEKTLLNRLSQWESWGDFDPKAIKDLARSGVHIRLYKIPKQELAGLPANIFVHTIFESKGITNCAVISDEKIELGYKEIPLPIDSLSRTRAELLENRSLKDAIINELRDNGHYIEDLIKVRSRLAKDLEFHSALKGMGIAGEIAYLRGYVPHYYADRVAAAAKDNRWGVLIADPADEDSVPTLIKNPRWVSIIEPVFRVIEVVPGYRELDISLWFLLFFSVFFGMIIGDAGYGTIFAILTLASQVKFGAKLKSASVFVLLYILSGFAITWGLLTGTIFGQSWLPEWIGPLAPELQNEKSVQTLCFFLGALHLSVAHIWRAVLKAPSLSALSDLGWTAILWGGFFLARLLILGESLPQPVKWLFIIGAAFVILFTSPNRNVIKGIGKGFGSFLLSFVNSFTDVVSYIRLFAVGLAGVAVADAFNTMAMEVGFGSVFTGLATALILFLGHALNVLLGPMSVLVHGVRLNVLEFCSHADVTWSGFKYKPLSE